MIKEKHGSLTTEIRRQRFIQGSQFSKNFRRNFLLRKSFACNSLRKLFQDSQDNCGGAPVAALAQRLQNSCSLQSP
jgi:hypothetical protein